MASVPHTPRCGENRLYEAFRNEGRPGLVRVVEGSFDQSDCLLVMAKKHDTPRTPREMRLDGSAFLWREIAEPIVKQKFVTFSTRHYRDLYLLVG